MADLREIDCGPNVSFNRIPKLVLLGDSIFQKSAERPYGVFPDLVNRYARKFDVVNRGFSGYNTRWILHFSDRIASEFSDVPPGSIIVIFFGTNDCCEPGSDQHVPLDEFRRNLLEIVRKFSPTFSKTILVTPGLIDENGSAPGCRFRKLTTLIEYVNAVREVAQADQLECVNLHEAFLSYHRHPLDKRCPMPGDSAYAGNANPSRLLKDGIHFTSLAYRILAKQLSAKIGTPKDTPTFLPLWGTLCKLQNEGKLGDLP